MTTRVTAARVAVPIHDRLLLYVAVAVGCGLLLPSTATRLTGAVPYMLAGQVFGVALTLAAGEFGGVLRRPIPILVALAAQWTLLPLVGVALFDVAADPTLRTGALVVAVAPAEITSVLVALLAGGSGAFAVTCMAGSLAVGTVLTPIWVSTVLGPEAHVDRWALVTELALAVALPLVAGVALRTRWPRVQRLRPRALDLSAVCVVLVVFVSVGSARAFILSPTLLPCVGLCVILLLAGGAVGLLVAWPWRRHAHVWRALVFPVGMREFGVAAAVAIAVSPRAVGVAGVYGAMLMIASPLVARGLRIRHAER